MYLQFFRKDSSRTEVKASSTNWFDQVEKSIELNQEADEYRNMIENSSQGMRTRISSGKNKILL